LTEEGRDEHGLAMDTTDARRSMGDCEAKTLEVTRAKPHQLICAASAHSLEALMIVHVLRFRFKDGTAQEDVAACMEALQRVGQMESVSFAVIGQYAGPAADEYTHSAAFALADIEAFRRYMHEPVHREADFIVHPHVTNFDVFDISDEDNPNLPSEIADIQRCRLAADRELTSLISTRPED
jgi:hypothetical protein